MMGLRMMSDLVNEQLTLSPCLHVIASEQCVVAIQYVKVRFLPKVIGI